MTVLLKAKAKYIWSTSCQQVFNNVKRLLCATPVLTAPCLECLFELQLDASDRGAGAVLVLSDSNDVQRPVSYFS